MNEDLLFLYNQLKDGNFEEECYGRALRLKSGKRPRLFRLKQDLKKLDYLANGKVKNYLVYQRDAYIVPFDLFDGTVFGFMVKSLYSKSFMKVKVMENYPSFIGFEDFKDFKSSDPIVMCEGLKDVYALKIAYKYSLGYLQSKPADDLFDFVNKISNKVVLVPDRDLAGIFNVMKNKKYALNPKFHIGRKDAGEYFDHYDNGMIELIKLNLRNLGVNV